MRILIALLVITCSFPAWAACIEPAGVEGQIIYNRDWKSMQFCDNTNWISLGGVSRIPDIDYGGVVVSNDGDTWSVKGAGPVGSVQFAGSDGLLAGSASFSWNETTKTLTVAGPVEHIGSFAEAARPICYSALPNASPNGKSLIMVPLTSHTANLDAICNAVTVGWVAVGVAKPYYMTQDCSAPLNNMVLGGGYTSFVPKATFQTYAATTYPNCGPTNTMVCCTHSSLL